MHDYDLGGCYAAQLSFAFFKGICVPPGFVPRLMGIVGSQHRHLRDLLSLDNLQVLQPLGWSLPRALFPVDVTSLLPTLRSYPDKQFAQYIEEGLQFGF